MSPVKRLLDKASPLPWQLPADPGVNRINPNDAALIVYAVNRLPDYEAAVDALERLLLFVGPDADKFTTVQDARAAVARVRATVLA